MKKTLSVLGAFLLSCSLYAQAGQAKYVTLQGSTPGTVQTGNANVSGTVRAGSGGFFSLTGISLLAQTSATDGSNANPTVLVRAGVDQVSELLQIRTSADQVMGSLRNGDTAGELLLYNPIDGQDDSNYSRWKFNGDNDGITLDELGTGVQSVQTWILGKPDHTYSIFFDDMLTEFGSIGLEVQTGGIYVQADALFPRLNNALSLGIPGFRIFKDGYFAGNVDAASFSVATNPLVSGCGTTTTCSNTAGGRVVFGSVALSSGLPSTATVTGISPAFTSSSSYVCTATNATSATGNLVKVVNVTGASFTITGPASVTDVINYVCVGS